MATVNEQLRDESIAHAIWISRYSTGVANRMVKLLNESDAELTARLLVAMDGLDADSFTVTRLQALLASVRAVNHQAIQSILQGLSAELNDLAQHEARYQLSLFDALLPEFVTNVHPLVGISPDAVYAAAMAKPFQGRLLSEWASNLEADRLNRISNTVRQGFLLGDTTEQIARKVRGHANRGYQDGALQMSRANAASIAKTAVGHLAATARNSFAEANNDLMKGKQWLSTLDNRTTQMCRIRDRLKYTLDNKPIGHKVPYLQGPGKFISAAVPLKPSSSNQRKNWVSMFAIFRQEHAPAWTDRLPVIQLIRNGSRASRSIARSKSLARSVRASFAMVACLLMSSTPIKANG